MGAWGEAEAGVAESGKGGYVGSPVRCTGGFIHAPLTAWFRSKPITLFAGDRSYQHFPGGILQIKANFTFAVDGISQLY